MGEFNAKMLLYPLPYYLLYNYFHSGYITVLIDQLVFNSQPRQSKDT